MTKTNLKEVEKVAVELGSVEAVAKELKRVQSIKCRLKKQKGKATYETEMTEAIKQEQILKEARQLLDPKEKPVTMYSKEDVDLLDYDETIKAIRSIQSKKTLSRWLKQLRGTMMSIEKLVRLKKCSLKEESL